MWTTPIIDPKSLVITVHDVMAGTEKTTMMAQWPSSQGRTKVNRMDIKNACLLMTKLPISQHINEVRASFANDTSQSWESVAGLRTVDRTEVCEDGTYFIKSFYLFTHKKFLKEFLETNPMWIKVKEMYPNLQHRAVDLLEGTEATAELGCYAQAPVWKNLRPTKQDVCNSVVVTSEFKLINIDAAGARGHMKAQGCKEWATVKGLRSKWFWFDEPTMTMGGVYTFKDKESCEIYK